MNSDDGANISLSRESSESAGNERAFSGAGLYLIVLLNGFWLYFGLWMIKFGFHADALNALAVPIFAPLFAALQVVSGLLPARLYISRHSRKLTRTQVRILKVLPIAALALMFVGFIVIFIAPHRGFS